MNEDRSRNEPCTRTKYTYDNDGNTLTNSNSSGTTQHVWDLDNRLTSVTFPTSGGTVTFKYDPFGNRIQKSSSSGTTNYFYDGSNVVEELDATGSALAHFTFGAAVDEPFATLQAGPTSFYNVDALGSVTSLMNSGGALVETYTFDSFGRQIASSGSVLNPFQYTGREFDPETGLTYLRSRYVDPNIGRFLSEDPLQFRGDGPNFYPYVRNNPVVFLDPFGLSSLYFNSAWGTITIFDGNGNVVGTYPAANNAQTGSRGPWQPGTWDYAYHTTHPDDSPDSRYGSSGNFVFNVPGCQGCGVHSGRAHVPDRKGRQGPRHATNGCIRTTDDATHQINVLNSTGDPLTTLVVQ